MFAQLGRFSVPKTTLGNEQGWKVPTGDAGARDRKLVLAPGVNGGDALSDEIERLEVGG